MEDLLLSLSGTKDCVEEHGIVITASLSAVGQVSECFQKGYLLPQTVERLCEHTLSINQRILETIRHVLVNKVKLYLSDKHQDDELAK